MVSDPPPLFKMGLDPPAALPLSGRGDRTPPPLSHPGSSSCYVISTETFQSDVRIKGHSSHVFNEVADELAAIGRATDTSSDELPQSTAELSDRFGRALQAIGDAELADWQGFELMRT